MGMDTWILRMCRQTCVRQLVGWIFIVLAVILLMYFGFARADAREGSSNSYIGIGIIGLIFGLTFAYATLGLPWKSWRYLKEPSKHPVIQKTQAWGDPSSISAEIEYEYLNEVWLKHFTPGLTDNYFFTKNYVIKKGFFSFDILRFDLLWAYRQVTKEGFKSGKSYEVIMIFNGGRIERRDSEEEIDRILREAADRAPWAFFGHTRELQDLYREDTEKLRTAVEERKLNHPKV